MTTTTKHGNNISTLYKMALGKAMGNHFSELPDGDYITWYESYVRLTECEDDDELNEHFIIWEDFEYLSLSEIIDAVETVADNMYSDFVFILDTAQKGIIKTQRFNPCFGKYKTSMLDMFDEGYSEYQINSNQH